MHPIAIWDLNVDPNHPNQGPVNILARMEEQTFAYMLKSMVPPYSLENVFFKSLFKLFATQGFMHSIK